MRQSQVRRRRLIPLLAAGLLFTAVDALPQPPPAPGIVLTCEVSCSATKLRTAEARIGWTLAAGPAGAAALGLGDLARVEQRLETTVFKNGFDKNLYASFPTLQRGFKMEAAAAATPAMAQLRAYQLQIGDVEQPSGPSALAAGGELETHTLVEGLEPGMNYTWRVVLETADGRMVSGEVTCEAPVCPADLQEAQP